MMFGTAISDDYEPVTWVGRYPVYVTTLLVIMHVASMILGCFLIAFGGGAFLNLLAFDSAQVISNLHFWQIATYAFVHPPSNIIWFAIEMYMLFVFGREVERFLGRRAFIVLYLLLLIVPTMLLAIWGLWQRTGLDGSATIHFAIFVAFAAIYPNVELFLRVMAKWVALIFVAAYSLQLLAYHRWSELTLLWISVALAYGFVNLRGAGRELGWLSDWTGQWRSKRVLRVVPSPETRRPSESENIYESIDPLLEKISKSGIGSLTASERRALDRARTRLINKSE
jgi:hypothetical protein